MPMIRLNPSELAEVLASMPISQIAGLLTASPGWKERAAIALSNDIVSRIEGLPPVDKDQLTLRL